MAWTAIPVEIVPLGDRAEVAVEMNDGQGRKFVQRFQTDGRLATVRQQVLATIVSQDRLKADSNIVLGTPINTTPDPPPAAPVDPNPVRTAWLLKYRSLLQKERALAIGVIGPGDAALKALRADIVASYDPSYETVL